MHVASLIDAAGRPTGWQCHAALLQASLLQPLAASFALAQAAAGWLPCQGLPPALQHMVTLMSCCDSSLLHC